MWATILKKIVQWFLLPLVTGYIDDLINYFKNKKDDKDRNDKIDRAVDKIKDSKSIKEKKDALDDLLDGVGELRAAKRVQNKTTDV